MVKKSYYYSEVFVCGGMYCYIITQPLEGCFIVFNLCLFMVYPYAVHRWLDMCLFSVPYNIVGFLARHEPVQCMAMLFFGLELWFLTLLPGIIYYYNEYCSEFKDLDKEPFSYMCSNESRFGCLVDHQSFIGLILPCKLGVSTSITIAIIFRSSCGWTLSMSS